MAGAHAAWLLAVRRARSTDEGDGGTKALPEELDEEDELDPTEEVEGTTGAGQAGKDGPADNRAATAFHC